MDSLPPPPPPDLETPPPPPEIPPPPPPAFSALAIPSPGKFALLIAFVLFGTALLVGLGIFLPAQLLLHGLPGLGGSSEPKGLYLRLESTYWNSRLSYEQRHYYFPAAGKIYDGVPAGGLDNFSWDNARKAEPKNCGSYRISGGKMETDWGGGRARTSQKFAWKENGFELDGLYNDHVGSFDKGQKLLGAYGAGSSVGGGAYTYVASARSLSFKPDGTFTGGAVGSFSTAGSRSGREVSGGSSSQDSGTYKLTGGNTLELRHADGKTTVHTVYPWGEKGDPRQQPNRLSIDGKLFKLENKNP